MNTTRGEITMTLSLKNIVRGMGNVLNLSPNNINDFPTKNVSGKAGNIERHFVAVEKTLKKVVKHERNKKF